MFGYRCYSQDGQCLGWLYAAHQERELSHTENPENFHWCKRWKTERGARRDFAYYNRRYNSASGGYLKIEQFPDAIAPKPPNQSQKKWDKAHPEIVREVKARYDEANPIWTVRFKEKHHDLLVWLEEERWDGETNQALLIRKLKKLMQMERQGY